MQLESAEPQTEPASPAVHFHPDVIAGISRDVREQPEQVFEGLLFGHRSDDRPDAFHIERYQRLESEAATAEHLGIYRATARHEENPPPPAAAKGISVSIFPDGAGELLAQVSVHRPDSEPVALQPPIPFSISSSHPAAKARRFVADFDVPADLPGREPRLPRELPARPASAAETGVEESGALRRYGPFAAALGLIGIALWVAFGLPLEKTSPGAALAPLRPPGLYVDTSATPWRISWNHDATMLLGASTVRLFVQDGEEHSPPELSANDLENAESRYQPQGKDVTFRLEATAKDGRVTAESFRVVQTTQKTATSPLVQPRVSAYQQPRVAHRVAPVVSAGVRSRIQGRTGVDVKVEIDTGGRVVSARAESQRGSGSGVRKYLAERALTAARGWRFEPATKNGQAVRSAYTIHFTFDR
jgi:TonB family protein